VWQEFSLFTKNQGGKYKIKLLFWLPAPGKLALSNCFVQTQSLECRIGCAGLSAYVCTGRDMAAAEATLVALLLFGQRCAYITSMRKNTYKKVEPLMSLSQLPCPYHCTWIRAYGLSFYPKPAYGKRMREGRRFQIILNPNLWLQ